MMFEGDVKGSVDIPSLFPIMSSSRRRLGCQLPSSSLPAAHRKVLSPGRTSIRISSQLTWKDILNGKYSGMKIRRGLWNGV